MAGHGAVEIDERFFDRMEELNIRLGEAERELVYCTDGLSALEKKLMIVADEAFYAQEKKRLPEYLQRREAKADPRYINMIRAKSRAQERRTTLRGQIDIMKLKFEEWRTRSADRRNSI